MKINHSTTLNSILLLFLLSISITSTAQTYTLTDSDVVVNSGVIASCSYDFALTDIIIPDVLDGQSIIGMGEFSFYQKGITSIIFPNTLEFTGYYAFGWNSINTIDFSNCGSLNTIGKMSFHNSYISNLNLAGCLSLTTISENAFRSNNLTNMDFSDCINLDSIGEWAFYDNELTTLDLTPCVNLGVIGWFSFAWNNLSSVNIHDNLTNIGGGAFNHNQITNFNGNNTDGTFYKRNNDGSCDSTSIISYGGTSYNIIIPEGVIEIKEHAFQGNGILSVDFSQCAESLEKIEYMAFRGNRTSIINLDTCNKLKHLGEKAFWETYGLTSILIQGCTSLTYIGEYCFQTNTNPGLSFILPTPAMSDSIFSGWEDEYGNIHPGGEEVFDMYTYYDAIMNPTYIITITVTDGTNSIENANVNLTGYGDQTTDATGIVIFSDVIPENDIVYNITATGFEDYTDSISVVDTDISEQVTLILTTYSVTFTVTDGTDPIENTTVTLTGYGDQITDASGIAIFNEVAPENDITYSVIAAGYIGYNGSVSVVDADVSELVTLTPAITSYNVTFTVTDGTSPISAATLNLTGYGSQTTDNNGKTTFTEVSPGVDIPYNTSASGFNTFYGFVTVIDEDIEESITLFLSSYSVTFEITDDFGTIEGALVELENYGSQTTNNSGVAIFTDVLQGSLDYIVSQTQYLDVSGTVKIENENVYKVILLTPTVITNKHENIIKLYPNPAQNKISIINAQNSMVTFFSKNGKIIKTIKNYDSEMIDINELSSGVYIVKVNNSIHKLIISK